MNRAWMGGRSGVPDLAREGPFDVHQDRPHSVNRRACSMAGKGVNSG